MPEPTWKKAKYTIAGRQKLMKLAAKSDHGWATVDEDDDKRIQRAEARAAKKIKKKQPTKRQRNSRKIGRPVRILSLLLLTIFFFVGVKPSGRAEEAVSSVGRLAIGKKAVQQDDNNSRATAQPTNKFQHVTNVIIPKVKYDIHMEMLSKNSVFMKLTIHMYTLTKSMPILSKIKAINQLKYQVDWKATLPSGVVLEPLILYWRPLLMVTISF